MELIWVGRLGWSASCSLPRPGLRDDPDQNARAGPDAVLLPRRLVPGQARPRLPGPLGPARTEVPLRAGGRAGASRGVPLPRRLGPRAGGTSPCGEAPSRGWPGREGLGSTGSRRNGTRIAVALPAWSPHARLPGRDPAAPAGTRRPAAQPSWSIAVTGCDGSPAPASEPRCRPGREVGRGVPKEEGGPFTPEPGGSGGN